MHEFPEDCSAREPRDCGHSADAPFRERKLYANTSANWPFVSARRECENPAMKPTANDTHRFNEYGQPIGFALPDWKAPPFPPHTTLAGRYCRLEPLDAATACARVFEAQLEDHNGERWTYLFHGPYTEFAVYERWCAGRAGVRAIRSSTRWSMRRASAPSAPPPTCASSPAHGVIEVGNIYFSPRLAQTRAATEAHLSVHRATRSRWAIAASSGNATAATCRHARPRRASASRTKALFRQAIVNKGRNRDTTWFAIIDQDWNGGLQGRLSTLARSGELRCRGTAEAAPVRAHRAVRARAGR